MKINRAYFFNTISILNWYIESKGKGWDVLKSNLETFTNNNGSTIRAITNLEKNLAFKFGEKDKNGNYIMNNQGGYSIPSDKVKEYETAHFDLLNQSMDLVVSDFGIDVSLYNEITEESIVDFCKLIFGYEEKNDTRTKKRV